MPHATDGRRSTRCTVSKSICFLLALTMFTSPSLTGYSHAAERSHHARVTLLKDQNYYEAVIRGIRTARKEIAGCFFIFKVAEKRNNLPMVIIRELIAAHKRGVAVTIVLELAAPDKGDVNKQNRKAADLLSAAGIKVRFDGPETTTHVKAMVIDNRYVYIGSHNLTQSALKYNNELSVMIDSSELAAETGAYLKTVATF